MLSKLNYTWVILIYELLIVMLSWYIWYFETIIIIKLYDFIYVSNWKLFQAILLWNFVSNWDS